MLKYSCEISSAHSIRNYEFEPHSHKHWHVYNTKNVLIIPKINHIHVIIYRYLLIKILSRNLKQTRDIIDYLMSNMKIQLLYSRCLKFFNFLWQKLRGGRRRRKKKFFFEGYMSKFCSYGLLLFIFSSSILHFRQ